MIYYVEDDENIRDLAIYALKQAGLEARGLARADEFFEALDAEMPEVVLLDIMLPETDGLAILARLRENTQTVHLPVMMLTAKGTEYDTVTGLDSGADDYLVKPFGMMELVSRVKALMRRASHPAALDADILSLGAIRLSPAAHTVTDNGIAVELTPKEFDLLRMLIEHEGHVLSRGQLLETVWDLTFAGGTRTVDVHIQTLRQKLAEACPGSEACICTVRGVGYCAKDQG